MELVDWAFRFMNRRVVYVFQKLFVISPVLI